MLIINVKYDLNIVPILNLEDHDKLTLNLLFYWLFHYFIMTFII